MRRRAGRATIGAAAVVALLSGCAGAATVADEAAQGTRPSITVADDSFHGTVMEPARPRPSLVLPTTSGELFDLGARPEDEVTVVFFGYTHCPDLCPTTMADLALARGLLQPQDRDRVAVVFVTEDPARDTPELVREWLDRFDPQFTGLIGGNEATAAALDELYLPETGQVADPSGAIVHPHDEGQHGHGDYALDHAGIVYAWGPGGRSVIYTGGTTPEQYAEDFDQLTGSR